MNSFWVFVAGVASCLALVSQWPRARAADAKSNAVTSGEFVIDPPTLINLGFEWMIQGDDNRNAAVAVSYREKGESQWRQGMPLMRLQNERFFRATGWMWSRQTCSPEASWISSRTRDTKQDLSCQIRMELMARPKRR